MVDLGYHGLAQRVLKALSAAGIPVMPLKGLFFAYWVYADPAERLGGDIDLLVPASEFGRAVRVLAGAGFHPGPFDNPKERTLLAPEMPIEIDLHRELFVPGRYRLSAEEVFARGRAERTRFPVEVVVPDPLDALAHLVGHAASGHAPTNAPRQERDVELLAQRFALDPRTCADHLMRLGLGRAARYTFHFFGSGARFAREVERHLAPDPIGSVLARVAWTVAKRCTPWMLLSRAAGQLTAASLPSAAISSAMMVANRLRCRLGWDPVLRARELFRRA
jgi:hypothetical protein